MSRDTRTSAVRSNRSGRSRAGIASLLGAVLLGVTLGSVSAPAQASEVVKLARLLLTGKRAASPPPSAPQPPAGDARNGTESGAAPQSRAADSSGEVHAMTRRADPAAATAME